MYVDSLTYLLCYSVLKMFVLLHAHILYFLHILHFVIQSVYVAQPVSWWVSLLWDRSKYNPDTKGDDTQWAQFRLQPRKFFFCLSLKTDAEITVLLLWALGWLTAAEQKILLTHGFDFKILFNKTDSSSQETYSVNQPQKSQTRHPLVNTKIYSMLTNYSANSCLVVHLLYHIFFYCGSFPPAPSPLPLLSLHSSVTSLAALCRSVCRPWMMDGVMDAWLPR